MQSASIKAVAAGHATATARAARQGLGNDGGTTASLCPFHDGAATLDLLLAELDPRERELFDAALDLRSAAAAHNAAACAALLFRVRSLLAGHHYLAFYRVRCWARRALRLEVRAHRQADPLVRAFPLDAARFDEVVNSALAPLARDGELPAGAHVRVVFAAAEAQPLVRRSLGEGGCCALSTP